ncbi:MAG: threonylcarbamoyl-AMP synthase [Azonexus sp.]|jgi:L-threonylcarbamoyladenylate synthase|nr:threonylcarbamoyl-AMP synthase [Azonexus sp.]
MTPANADFQYAVDLLRNGQLVAIPTETVYGLAADAANPEAVARIFAAKGRPADHPLIVHLAAANAVDHWAENIPDFAWELMETFWPGPLTLILKKQPWVPEAVTGGQNTVGLRVPGHPVALELLRRFATATGPRAGLAAPSANRFGHISPTTAAHVAEELGNSVPFILDGGPSAVGIESTIIDCSRENPVILRPGHIAPEHLATVLDSQPEIATSNSAPRVSGSLEAHYAPRTPLRLIAENELPAFLETRQGHRCGILSHTPPPPETPHRWRQLPANPDGYAHCLYAALRDMDQAAIDLIIVEAPPASAAWAAINDRLRRAAAGSGR